ncbi:tonB-dependent siderophore receptor family protein [Janthinobacterium agaricidamnosum NBRC 102515 = DSM 9628]|uniref:TonB-dependent siderophore receptor family protein n=1 Tax=Janthinobacterium agaricidamnosum NBRC 102515 = DSM 9628 TaxID=1349767 RepID=W0V8Z5_9BURK|nr:tonB-dependent siderophore receptor family protein [Janthinobacterium agaricidamnosum NBRC 102515 = DSM 9628]
MRGSGLSAAPQANGSFLVQRAAAAHGASPHTAVAATGAPVLSEVVVVGARTPTRITEIPSTAWIIASEQITAQARAGVPLKEMLGNLVPGLDIGPQGRTAFGQNLRGRSALVMIDGVSLNGSRALSRQFDSIDPFNIERIEVLSGASALYGGNATGGVINIVTRRAASSQLAFTSEAGLRSGLRNGDDLDWHVAQSLAGGNQQVFGRLGIVYGKTGAAYDGNGNGVIPDITQTDLQYNQSIDILGNLDLRLAQGRHLKLLAQVYDSGYRPGKALYLGRNLGGAIQLSAAPVNPALLDIRDGFSSDIKPRTKRHMFSADYHADQIAGGQDFYLQAYTRSEKLDFYPFPGIDNYVAGGVPGRALNYAASRQNTDTSGLKAVFAKQFDKVKLTYGVDYDHEQFEGKQVLFDTAQALQSGGLVFRQSAQLGRYPGFKTDIYALYGQADWRIGQTLSLSGGVRRQRADIEVDDFVQAAQQRLIAAGIGRSAQAIPGGKNSYEVTLFNAGLLYKLSPQQQAWTNYSEGFELADPAKYYGQGNYTLAGGATGTWNLLNSINAGAAPMSGIKTRQLEAGWRHRGGPLALQTALFYSKSDKAIDVNRSTFDITLVDQKVRNIGLEGQVNYSVDEQWDTGANWLAIITQQQGNGDWNKRDVTVSSPSKLTSYVGWKQAALALRLQGTQVFALADASGKRLTGYALFDLLGAYRLPKGTLSFGIQNLLNRDYTTTWGQRSKILYGGLIAAQALDYKGRGRSFGVTYALDY